VGPIALAERKAKAFLGYTYRRPEVFALGGMEEGAGRKLNRQSVFGVITAPVRVPSAIQL
jgi:hypothetical protein